MALFEFFFSGDKHGNITFFTPLSFTTFWQTLLSFTCSKKNWFSFFRVFATPIFFLAFSKHWWVVWLSIKSRYRAVQLSPYSVSLKQSKLVLLCYFVNSSIVWAVNPYSAQKATCLVAHDTKILKELWYKKDFSKVTKRFCTIQSKMLSKWKQTSNPKIITNDRQLAWKVKCLK